MGRRYAVLMCHLPFEAALNGLLHLVRGAGALVAPVFVCGSGSLAHLAPDALTHRFNLSVVLHEAK